MRDSADPAQLALSLKRRDDRFRLRDVLRDVSSVRRVKLCGCKPIKKGFGVDVKTAEGRAHYANVQSCGSIALCPVCSPKIRDGRCQEIRAVLSAHLKTGGGAYFGMLTLPHDWGDTAGEVIGVCAGAFSRVLAGRAYASDRKRYGIIGTIRALEVTHGKNGFHPHIHPCILTDRQLTPAELEDLRSSIFARWSAGVQRAGYRAPDSRFTTLHPIRSAKDVADYVAKVEGKERSVALELARVDLKRGRSSDSRKGGRTMFQVLEDFADAGDEADLRVWVEYEQAIQGRQHITFSKGLRALYAVAEDRTDEDLAAPEIGGEVLYTLSADEWRRVILARKRAALLRAAELRGRAGVVELLCEIFDAHNRRRGRVGKLADLFVHAPECPELGTAEA